MNKIILAICMLTASLPAIFGLYLFVKGARRIQQAIASIKWPVVPGTVVSSETTRDVSTYRRKTSVTFDTKTTIRYIVKERDYNTDQFRFGQLLGSSDKSDAVLQRHRYPAGKEVPVSYDPANPATAVMKPGLHAEAFWLQGAGLAFLLPAVLCMFLLPRMILSTGDDDQAFANFVHSRMEGGHPDFVPPPVQSGDKVMPIAAAAFAAVFCCLGILAITAGLQRIGHGAASQNWPVVGGLVVETGGEELNDTTDAAYRARLIYKYEVKGITHFNNLRRFAEVESTAHYKMGDHVKVSYSPADPDLAVIEPGNASAAMILPGIGMVLLLMSLATFCWVVPAVGK